jgi:phage/plasmid-like protein (TIGR03299 family)
MPANVETMFYTGETPWHGLGTKLDKVATAEEAIIAAGLNWKVECREVLTHTKTGLITIPNYFAITRESDDKIFAIMKQRFTPVQNHEAFRFFDELVADKLAMYHTAGSLNGGAIIWIMAKLPAALIIKDEEIDKYTILVHSHDGSYAFNLFHSGVRVVCYNTLVMAESSGTSKFYARHTSHVLDKVDKARLALGISTKLFKNWKEQAEKMANVQLPAAQRPLFLKAAFTGNYETKDDEIWHPIKMAMEKADELISAGRGQDNPKIAGTKWQAYNGVTEYVDYYNRIKDNNQDKRLMSAWFGRGKEIKERAWDYLLKV